MCDLLRSLRPLGPTVYGDLGSYAETFARTLQGLQRDQAVRRIWARDGSFWAGDDADTANEVEQRLGWLDLPRDMGLDVPRLKALAVEVRAAGITRVVLLGMGGSSLAPEVMAAVLSSGENESACELVILDSTDPAQIRRIEQQAPLAQTLFIVASKSGTTAETDSLYAYFAGRMTKSVGEDEWGSHFVAITDPATRLARLAIKDHFRALYLNPPDIGGRYSALSLFGLVPAALAGVDLERLLLSAREMAWSCRSTIPAAEHPGVVLGAIMGACAKVDKTPADKLTLMTSPRLAAFGPWAEQLIAESTGKNGVGILPVEGEDLALAAQLSRDRLFVYLRLQGDDNKDSDELSRRLLEQDYPLVLLELEETYDLGAELFRWEFATATAGRVLGINPFDQPDVESAKQRARQAISAYEESKALPQLPVLFEQDGLGVSGPGRAADDVAGYLASVLGQVQEGQYVALMAYVDRSGDNQGRLQIMRNTLVAELGVPVTLGFGPRFLHSTGQLHKGGPNSGLFVQIVQEEARDLPIPGREYSFGVLKQAQALGDWEALQDAGRQVVCLHIGADVQAGLERLEQTVTDALRSIKDTD